MSSVTHGLMDVCANALVDTCGVPRQVVDDPHVDALVNDRTCHIPHDGFDIQIVTQRFRMYTVVHLPAAIRTIAQFPFGGVGGETVEAKRVRLGAY